MTSGYLLWMAARLRQLRPSPAVDRWAGLLGAAVAAQVVAGFLNVALRAPNWMQLTHLLLACIMWLMTVMLGYSALTAQREPAQQGRAPAGAQA
ncbi:COX15/CtaA family protein [Deinococcus lacus]|uniref:COX15/CtaA family protein n=1 Tax=Deinococcus lacus TaxID=392561 RepID=A0ABW1YFE9_9DEIO